MKAAHDAAVMVGWESERFTRTQRIKPLGEDLRPPREVDKRAQGALDVKRMFDKRIKRQEADRGTR
jgi:hypothetical protein